MLMHCAISLVDKGLVHHRAEPRRAHRRRGARRRVASSALHFACRLLELCERRTLARAGAHRRGGNRLAARKEGSALCTWRVTSLNAPIQEAASGRCTSSAEGAKRWQLHPGAMAVHAATRRRSRHAWAAAMRQHAPRQHQHGKPCVPRLMVAPSAHSVQTQMVAQQWLALHTHEGWRRGRPQPVPRAAAAWLRSTTRQQHSIRAAAPRQRRPHYPAAQGASHAKFAWWLVCSYFSFSLGVHMTRGETTEIRAGKPRYFSSSTAVHIDTAYLYYYEMCVAFTEGHNSKRERADLRVPIYPPHASPLNCRLPLGSK